MLQSLPDAIRSKRQRDLLYFFFSSGRRHTRSKRDWSSDVGSSDLLDRRIPPDTARDGLGRVAIHAGADPGQHRDPGYGRVAWNGRHRDTGHIGLDRVPGPEPGISARDPQLGHGRTALTQQIELAADREGNALQQRPGERRAVVTQ